MYRKIDTSIWTDPKFKDLPLEEKDFFLYSITNNHSHFSGIYYLPRLYMSVETGIDHTLLDRVINTLSDRGLIRYDDKTEVIWVRNMFKRQGKGKKLLAGAANHLETLHETELIPEFLAHYPAVEQYREGGNGNSPQSLLPFTPAEDTVSDTVSDRVSDFGPQEQEQKQYQDQEQDQEREKSKKLSLDEKNENEKGENPETGLRFEERIDLIVSYYRRRSGKKKFDYDITPVRHAHLVKMLRAVQKKFEARALFELEDVRYFAYAVEGIFSKAWNTSRDLTSLCEDCCKTLEKLEHWRHRGFKRSEQGLLKLLPITKEEAEAMKAEEARVKAEKEEKRRRAEEARNRRWEDEKRDQELRERPRTFERWKRFCAGEDIGNPFLTETFRDWQEGDGPPEWILEMEASGGK